MMEDHPSFSSNIGRAPRQRRDAGWTQDIWPVTLDRSALGRLLLDLFANHWHRILWGPGIPDTIYNFEARCKPDALEVSEMGYLAVAWEVIARFRVFLGKDAPDDDTRTRPEMVQLSDADDTPVSWSLRLINRDDLPVFALFFLFDEEAETIDQPALWTELFPRLTGQIGHASHLDRSDAS